MRNAPSSGRVFLRKKDPLYSQRVSLYHSPLSSLATARVGS